MLGLGGATRIYVATGNTDMRLGFNGLHALVDGKLQQNPRSGHLFLFANKRRDRMKIFFFDTNSLWVCARRMEKGACIGRCLPMAACSCSAKSLRC